MAWHAAIRDGVRPLVDFLYPPRCPACGTAIADQRGLCLDCWSQLEPPPAGAINPGPVPVHAAAVYNDTSRKLVLAYKHGGRITLARLLARFIAVRLPEVRSGQKLPLLIPVPLHRWRLWRRGFNQAALLASELARAGKGEVLADGLLRRKRTPSLGGLGRRAREQVLQNAITINPVHAARLAGRDIILVDDVLTSGATSGACVAALGAAQARSIRIACFAQVTEEAG